MKKRLMMSLMVIGLVAALVGGATFALWTASGTVENNTFTATEMTFSGTAGSVDGMYPGLTKTMTVTITNPNPYDIVVDAVSLDSIACTAGKNGSTPDGAAYSIALGAGDKVIPANTSETVDVDVNLALSAGDEYQLSVADVDLTFHATQQ